MPFIKQLDSLPFHLSGVPEVLLSNEKLITFLSRMYISKVLCECSFPDWPHEIKLFSKIRALTQVEQLSVLKFRPSVDKYSEICKFFCCWNIIMTFCLSTILLLSFISDKKKYYKNTRRIYKLNLKVRLITRWKRV